MSNPLQEQQQQLIAPPLAPTPTHSSHGGSVGAVIAVLAVVTILGIIAGFIGRLCSGRRVIGQKEYDLEAWLEKKCSSCIDGRIDIPQPAAAAAAAPAAAPSEPPMPEAIPIQVAPPKQAGPPPPPSGPPNPPANEGS